MHGSVRHDDKYTREYSKADYIRPKCEGIDAKSAEDRCARDLDIEAIFVVDESEICNLIDAESFEAIVKYRELSKVSNDSR